MKFKKGDKVKVEEKLISKLSNPSVIKTLRMKAKIIKFGSTMAKIQFPNNKEYWIWFDDLKLANLKNEQLLFDFMEQND